ncbi:TIGR03618 family F420-dependent PPOX class oxidoreductase [Nocardioides fonticola]|uniref:TIGR03618 family F420-dependent PPOX class oxidoreductase n=1 Tax=Nocardioides fonticola TaxID=450363 RepID=A0ABP7XHX8_9ACTN
MSSFEPGWGEIPAPLLEFWTQRHLCTLTTLRPDGRPHVVPVGVALDPEQECAWVITNPGSRKARNVLAGAGAGQIAACQVDGPRWSTIEGTAELRDDAASVARAVERYASRYRQPRENPDRVALRLTVERFVFGPGLLRVAEG